MEQQPNLEMKAISLIEHDRTDELTKTNLLRSSRRDRLSGRLALLWVVALFTSCATPDRGVSPTKFAALDLNKDNKVARVEYSRAKLLSAFKKLDLNGDQKITPDEWNQFDKSPQAAENFRALDESGDQLISLAEFLDLAPKHSTLDQIFTAMDVNADNYLSRNELNEEPAVKLFSVPF